MSTPISAGVAFLVDVTTEAERPKAMARLSASLIGGFLMGSILASLLGGLGFAPVCFIAGGLAACSTLTILIGGSGATGETKGAEGSVAEAATTDDTASDGGADESATETPRFTTSGLSRRDLSVDDVEAAVDAEAATTPSLAPVGEDEAADAASDGEAAAADGGSDDVVSEDIMAPGRVIRSRYFAPVGLSGFLTGIAFGFNVTLAPLICIEKFDFTQLEVSLVYLGVVIILLLVNLLAYAPLVRLVGVKRLTPLSLGVTCVFCATGPLGVEFDSIVYMMLVFVVLSVNNALLRPTVNLLGAKVASKLSPSSVGRIMGANQGLFSVGQAISPIVFASLYAEAGSVAAFTPFAALLLLTSVTTYWHGTVVLDQLDAFVAQHRRSNSSLAEKVELAVSGTADGEDDVAKDKDRADGSRGVVEDREVPGNGGAEVEVSDENADVGDAGDAAIPVTDSDVQRGEEALPVSASGTQVRVGATGEPATAST